MNGPLKVKKYWLLKKNFAARKQAVKLPPHPFTCQSLKLIGKVLLYSSKVDIIFTAVSSGRFRPFLNSLSLLLELLTRWTVHVPKSKVKFRIQLFFVHFEPRRQKMSEGNVYRYGLENSGLKAQRCRKDLRIGHS